HLIFAGIYRESCIPYPQTAPHTGIIPFRSVLMSHAIAGASVDGRYKDFLELTAEAARRVLMIDYDGTVAPFATDRARAFPYPRVAKLLEIVMKQCRTRVIMITGGPAHRVGPLLGLHPAPETWGAYGLERLTCDGQHHGVEIPDATFD